MRGWAGPTRCRHSSRTAFSLTTPLLSTSCWWRPDFPDISIVSRVTVSGSRVQHLHMGHVDCSTSRRDCYGQFRIWPSTSYLSMFGSKHWPNRAFFGTQFPCPANSHVAIRPFTPRTFLTVIPGLNFLASLYLVKSRVWMPCACHLSTTSTGLTTIFPQTLSTTTFFIYPGWLSSKPLKYTLAEWHPIKISGSCWRVWNSWSLRSNLIRWDHMPLCGFASSRQRTAQIRSIEGFLLIGWTKYLQR